MAVPDPIAELVALLANTETVTTLASGVYGGGLPDTAKAVMPTGVVVVKPAGGPGRKGFLLYRRGRVDIVCMAATLYQSWQLHLAVRETLENLQRTGSLIDVAVVSDGTNAIDPLTQWPTCYASYQVTSATST